MSNKTNWIKNRYKTNQVVDMEYLQERKRRPNWTKPLSPQEYRELELYLQNRCLVIANPEVLLEEME